MPRIPVRIEPYTSPSRQHRHFKNKRDQVLRALGKAAYINGSHFAIMWVSARGDVETYASEALQDRLDGWFVKSGISEEAKELVIGAQGNPRANPFKGGDDDNDEDGEDLSDDERGLMLQVPGASNTSQASSSLTTPVMPTDDVFGEHNGRPNIQRSASTSGGMRGRKAGLALDTNVANEQYLKSRNSGHDDLQVQSAMEGHYMTSLHGLGVAIDGEELNPPHSAPLRMPITTKATGRASNSTQQHVPQFETRLDNQSARTAFLELRFSQLQQGMCKTVAKAWIKIIEPKKQTRCPYNKGEEGKPTWWPDGVRHKEPDHLMKPERHALLLTILRSPKIQVARLQLATAEVVALIKADKVSLLMDVYRIAREEEKMREAGIDMDTPMTVGVSTLDGWSEADQAVTTDRGASPAEEEAETPSNNKKRSAATMSRSASTSSVVKSNKRKMSAIESSSSPLMRQGESLDVPRSNSHRGSTWLMQEATQNNMKKAMSLSPATGYSASPQTGLEQHYGLLTPMTGSTQLMDHTFLQPAKEGNDSLVAGYMSAPQPSHAQLYPHNGFQFQNAQQQQQQHHYNVHNNRDATNLFAYQQQRMDNGSSGDNASSGQSALGLQGINMHWSNAGFTQDFGNDPNGGNGWWHHQQATHEHPSHHSQKDASNGDASFDTSFASTVDSAGPATPPLGGTPLQRSTSSSKPLHSDLNTTHDYLRQQQQHFAENRPSQQQQQQVGQGTRNQYNLSLAKVGTTTNTTASPYDSWTYPA